MARGRNAARHRVEYRAEPPLSRPGLAVGAGPTRFALVLAPVTAGARVTTAAWLAPPPAPATNTRPAARPERPPPPPVTQGRAFWGACTAF